MAKVICRITEVGQTMVGVGHAAKPEWFCSYMFSDAQGNKSGQIKFQENTTAEKLWASLKVEAEIFAKREQWLDDLKELETHEKDFDFPGIGGG